MPASIVAHIALMHYVSKGARPVPDFTASDEPRCMRNFSSPTHRLLMLSRYIYSIATRRLLSGKTHPISYRTICKEKHR
jgi:hypothetical protein